MCTPSSKLTFAIDGARTHNINQCSQWTHTCANHLRSNWLYWCTYLKFKTFLRRTWSLVLDGMVFWAWQWLCWKEMTRLTCCDSTWSDSFWLTATCWGFEASTLLIFSDPCLYGCFARVCGAINWRFSVTRLPKKPTFELYWGLIGGISNCSCTYYNSHTWSKKI